MINHLLTAVLLFNCLLTAQVTSLKDTSNQFDYVIITIPEFSEHCSVFKSHKEFNRGFKAAIVDTFQIFNEFDENKSRKENIREFISYAGTFWKYPQPKYFLIVGDLSMVPNFEFESIPNYPETDTSKSDYYYSESIFDEDEDVLDFCIGRLAARNGLEIKNYFDKVIEYESHNDVEQWNNTFSIIADNGICDSRDNGDIFERGAFQFGESLPDFINKIYFFESEDSPYYSSSDSIINFVNSEGTAGIYFYGHGNSEIFTCDTMFSIESFERLDNEYKYFIASFSHAQRISEGNSTSMLDQMLLSKFGAIAGFNSVGLSYAHSNWDLTRTFYQNIYSNNPLPVGEIVRHILSEPRSDYKKFNLFGDPSLIIKYDLPAQVSSYTDKIPNNYKLSQNYPNPFNPITIINYHTPTTENIRLRVFDLLGREVKTLIDGNVEAGYHKVSFDASGLNSGVYIYQLESNLFRISKKMLLLK